MEGDEDGKLRVVVDVAICVVVANGVDLSVTTKGAIHVDGCVPSDVSVAIDAGSNTQPTNKLATVHIISFPTMSPHTNLQLAGSKTPTPFNASCFDATTAGKDVEMVAPSFIARFCAMRSSISTQRLPAVWHAAVVSSVSGASWKKKGATVSPSY